MEKQHLIPLPVREFVELEHYLPVLVKKPRSLANAAPLRRANLPPGLNELKDRLLAREEDHELAKVS